jgi:hypothetical protein
VIGYFAMIKVGGRGWNRTTNLSIKSRMLCQLSYASEEWKGRMLSNIQKGRAGASGSRLRKNIA